MLIKGEIKDPRIRRIVTVTEVSVSKDLKDAKVYISVLGEEKAQDEVVHALRHAAGFIQRLLGKRVTLKCTPRLSFVLDNSLEKAYRLNQTLKGLIP